jgi:5-deoxy-D-glucuronate isomerase
MNTRILVAATLAIAAVGASAQEATYEQPQAVVSATTRAAVSADVLQARANGTLMATEFDRQAWAPFVSARSRADVRAETRAAAESGELRALHEEDNSFDGRKAAQSKSVSPAALAAL